MLKVSSWFWNTNHIYINNIQICHLILAMLPVKTDIPQSLCRLCPGARRSFFCRMKLKAALNNQIKEESDTSSSSRSSTKRKSKLSMGLYKYRVIQCTGYLKSWTPIKEENNDGDSDNMSCLVAIGRIPSNVLEDQIPSSLDNHPNIRHVNFLSRHSVDGKFLFIDQRYDFYIHTYFFTIIFY